MKIKIWDALKPIWISDTNTVHVVLSDEYQFDTVKCKFASDLIRDCSEFLVRGVGGLGYGWGSGKSGIWIKSFLYIKFFKKSLGQQIPMKIPTWPCIGTGKWEMWLDSLFWTHLQSDVGENYQVWSLESVLSRDLTSVCDKFLFLAQHG